MILQRTQVKLSIEAGFSVNMPVTTPHMKLHRHGKLPQRKETERLARCLLCSGPAIMSRWFICLFVALLLLDVLVFAQDDEEEIQNIPDEPADAMEGDDEYENLPPVSAVTIFPEFADRRFPSGVTVEVCQLRLPCRSCSESLCCFFPFSCGTCNDKDMLCTLLLVLVGFDWFPEQQRERLSCGIYSRLTDYSDQPVYLPVLAKFLRCNVQHHCGLR